MKYVGFLLMVFGLLLIGLCVALRVQFNNAVAQAKPNFDEYPLLRPFIPDLAPANSSVASAEQAAETTLFRLYSVGVVGLFIVIAGTLVLIVTFRPAKVPCNSP